MITCKDCGNSFEKPVQRGRPPLKCSDCRNTPAPPRERVVPVRNNLITPLYPTPRNSSFFSYFGGKAKIAKKYDAPVIPNDPNYIVVEPFAGAAGYSTLWYKNKVVLYDLYSSVSLLWRFLIRATPEEIRSIPAQLPLDKEISEYTYEDLGGKLKIEDLEGARIFIGFWYQRGRTIPAKKPSSWMSSGEYDNSFWGEKTRERIAKQVDRINHWVINPPTYEDIFSPDPGFKESMSYLDIPEELLAKQNATWHIDPPYKKMGVSYKKSAKDIDYDELGTWCNLLGGRVMVCENEGADWLPFEFLTDLHNTKKKVTKEVVWYNYDR